MIHNEFNEVVHGKTKSRVAILFPSRFTSQIEYHCFIWVSRLIETPVHKIWFWVSINTWSPDSIEVLVVVIVGSESSWSTKKFGWSTLEALKSENEDKLDTLTTVFDVIVISAKLGTSATSDPLAKDNDAFISANGCSCQSCPTTNTNFFKVLGSINSVVTASSLGELVIKLLA